MAFCVVVDDLTCTMTSFPVHIDSCNLKYNWALNDKTNKMALDARQVNQLLKPTHAILVCQVTNDAILQWTGKYVVLFYPINWLIWSVTMVWTVRALTLDRKEFNIVKHPARLHFCIGKFRLITVWVDNNDSPNSANTSERRCLPNLALMRILVNFWFSVVMLALVLGAHPWEEANFG